jgi:O-antigen/teichoic acid export membrane protein
LLSGILNLLLNWWLVPKFSIAGAALAGLIAGLLINYWYVFYRGVLCFRQLQLSPCTQ